jgi:dihydroxy-acid dehydratase
VPGGARPRVGVPAADLADELRGAGAEPVPLELPSVRPQGGVALAREWVADATQISCARQHLDGLLLAAEEPEELAGLVLVALRLDLPAVVAYCEAAYLSAALAALGLLPLAGDPASVAVEVAGSCDPRPRDLVDEFSLVNALRAGLSLGGGPELLVHLSAIAGEAGSIGFSRSLRVITPETPLLVEPDSGWFAEHGTAGLLARLGDALNDTGTVSGRLRELVSPSSVPEPPRTNGSRLVFVEARASGASALCRVYGGVTEVSGECRVYHSEKSAVAAVEEGTLEPHSLLIVGGCGPRGRPGLARLQRLSRVLEEEALIESVPVITDGLPPRSSGGTWISLFSPEAAVGGVLGRLRDGDILRIDLREGRIRTGVGAGEFARREPYEFGDRAAGAAGYAARYARTALPGLDGAGFG